MAVTGDDLIFGAETRMVAAVHFAAAGILLGAGSIWLLTQYRSDAAMDAVTEYWIDRSGSLAVLNSGDALRLLAPETATALAVAFAVLAIVQLGVAVSVARARRLRWCFMGGALGLVSVLALPLAFVGVVLMYLSRPTFGSHSPM